MDRFGPSRHNTQTALAGPKTGVVHVVQASLISPHASLFEDFLTRAGYKESLGPPGPAGHKPDTKVSVQALEVRLPGMRWTASDEAACTARCKRCQQPIIWGQCDFDTSGKDIGRWFPLDPDMGLHGCGHSLPRESKRTTAGVA